MYLINNLEISDDLLELNWFEALNMVKNPVERNNPFRLPTKLELSLMFINKDEINLFSNIYWSSEEYDETCAYALFSNGILNGWFKDMNAMLRLVRIV